MKKLRHLLEAFMLHTLFTALRLMPLDTASWLGGYLARGIGPFLRAHNIAVDNISAVFPALSPRERAKLVWDMWDNLGRTSAELVHLSGTALLKRVTVRGLEHLPPSGKPMIFFSGHIGNWELTYPLAHQHGIPLVVVYRKANNPYVDKMIGKIRGAHADGMFPKGPQGGIKLVRAIKDGQSLAMLVDQKMNDGIPVPFFGRDAMTAPAIAEFALRYDMPLIPARIVRTRGCHFEAIVHPAITYEKTGDGAKDALAIMTKINALLESWIREHPSQWFWVHKRWPN